MKFKVGDKVRIRKDLEVNKMYGRLNLLPEKAAYKGRTATVIFATDCEYTLDVDGGKWSWNDEMLETTGQPQSPRAFIRVDVNNQEFMDAIRKSFERMAGVKSSDDPDEQPDDALPATVEQPDDSNRSIYTPVTETTDNVNHPQHYKHGEIETLDIIRMSLTPEEFQGFLKGNVLKYQLRAPFKHATPDEDYKKAKFYYDEYREVEDNA